jgi:hypothetical protein
VQCSGANTSGTFYGYEDHGFYFRAVLQRAPAPVSRRTRSATVPRGALLMRSDDYGEGLGEAIQEALEEQGAEVARR